MRSLHLRHFGGLGCGEAGGREEKAAGFKG